MSGGREEMESRWEEQINALFDGELDPADVAELENAALADPLLARALEESRQLRELLEAAPAVRAPRSLRRKLLKIPAARNAANHEAWWLRGALVGAVALLLVMVNPGGPEQPGEVEIAQGRRDLALALSYLGRATDKTSAQIQRHLDRAAVDPVTHSTMDILRRQFRIEQEYYL